MVRLSCPIGLDGWCCAVEIGVKLGKGGGASFQARASSSKDKPRFLPLESPAKAVLAARKPQLRRRSGERKRATDDEDDAEQKGIRCAIDEEMPIYLGRMREGVCVYVLRYGCGFDEKAKEQE
jgi:hypothetical protein